jgi:dTDP-glucose 4,6-dehydratase
MLEEPASFSDILTGMARAVVTGGCGFLGSHVCRRLITEGWEVVCLDSLSTGNPDNITDLLAHEGFEFERRDVTKDLTVAGTIDWVLHFASPASPIDYLSHPIDTLKVGSLGTLHALRLAKEKGAGMLLASTSEVYGDPQVHPQPESYWGNVNPIGPRGVYDEAKRFAESLTMAYHKEHGIPVRIVRIFNTFGEGMRRDDGRAVPTFISQALDNRALTVHGDGSQTRSLCYVDDLIEGIWRFVATDFPGPLNLGNDGEVTVLELAELIRTLTGSSAGIEHLDRPVDDPEVRRPDLSLAREKLNWEPAVPLAEGLSRMITWAKRAWSSDQDKNA